jgi:hypothetical protein
MNSKFYSLMELKKFRMTTLGTRMLKYRMKYLLSAGILIIGGSLFKTGSQWQIHESLIPLFQRKSKLVSH